MKMDPTKGSKVKFTPSSLKFNIVNNIVKEFKLSKLSQSVGFAKKGQENYNLEMCETAPTTHSPRAKVIYFCYENINLVYEFLCI